MSRLVLAVTLAALSLAALFSSDSSQAADVPLLGFDHDGGVADINDGPISGNVGDVVTVSLIVEVEDGTEMGGWTMDVLYSNTVLAATSCTAHPVPTGLNDCNEFFSPTDVRVAGFELEGIPGVFNLMDITFELLGSPGQCSVLRVRPETIEYIDEVGNPLTTPTLFNGAVCINGTSGRLGFDHNGGAPDINAGPANVPAGGSVSVDVVAEIPALGLKAWSFNVGFNPAVLDATACAPHPASACNPDFDASTSRSAGAHLAGLFGTQVLMGVTYTAIGAPGTCSDLTITLDEYGTVVAPGESEPFIQYTPEILLGKVCVVAAEACADVTGDGRVRLVDVALITLRALIGPYNARFDLNHDGIVNRADIRIAIGQLGTTCQP